MLHKGWPEDLNALAKFHKGPLPRRTEHRERKKLTVSPKILNETGEENPVTTKPENLGLLQAGVLQDDLGRKPKICSE